MDRYEASNRVAPSTTSQAHTLKMMSLCISNTGTYTTDVVNKSTEYVTARAELDTNKLIKKRIYEKPFEN